MTTGARTQPQKLQLHTGFLQLKTHTLAVKNKGEIVEMGSHSALIVDLTEYIRDYTSSRTRQKIDIPLPSQKSPYNGQG